MAGFGLLFRGALFALVTLTGAVSLSATADPEAKIVALRRGDVGTNDFYEGVSARIRSLPVPLMERRALLAVTENAETRKQRTHGQGRHRGGENKKRRGTRSSEGSLSASSVRHPLCEEVKISKSYLSASETTRTGNPPENVLDGDLDTLWATEGLGSWLMVDLPETTALQGVAVAFGENSDGSIDDSQSFTMLVLGDNQMIHRPELNAGATTGLEFFGFEKEVLAKSVVLMGYGRQDHTSLAEIKLCRAQVGKTSSFKETGDDGDVHPRTNRRAKKNLRGSRRP